MEQCFRIAFCMMFLLTGYLQAPVNNPGCSFETGDLSIGLLKNLPCNGTMNFISPDMENEDRVERFVAALEFFRKGLDDAEKICTDEHGYLNDPRQVFDEIEKHSPNMKPTDYKFTTTVNEVQFGQFLNKFKGFFGHWKTICSKKE